MPYKFVDTIEPPATETMPAEAMKLNGEYIENLMDARYAKYRTLYVRGREMLSAEVQSFETGVRDGSSFLSRRYPERILTIGYTLQATDNYYFRMAFNELNKILNVENAEIIFYDEQDKYFIGTPMGVEEEPEPGSNFVKGEFTIICNDPFKYSIKEYEVEPTEDEGTTFVVDYGGTYRAYPTLEADFYKESECGDDGTSTSGMTGSGDCGYVAWFNEDSKIIQLGDPDEEDSENNPKSETLFSQSFRNVKSWTTELNAIWEKNYDIYVGADRWTGTGGETYFLTDDAGGMYMTCYNYGTAGNGWRGVTISRTLPADSNGDLGATDWTIKWTQRLCIGIGGGANTNRGGIQVILSDENDKVVAATNFWKGAENNGSTGNIWLHTLNSVSKKSGIDMSHTNARFSQEGSCTMTKSGSTVNYNLGGLSYSVTDASILNMTAVRVTFVLLALDNYSIMNTNGLFEMTFTKNNVDDWHDIPNKFTANDTVAAECASGTVLLNGSEAPEYGAIGNQWEEFYLSPGINQIGFSYSPWCGKAPTTKMRYREVFI